MKHLQLIAPLVLGPVLLLAGCAAPVSSISSEPTQGGTLIYAQEEEPTCLDPVISGNMSQATFALQYLDSLVSSNSDGVVEPWLASSWDVSADGTVYTFELREDVKFTDGTDFNAEAVKYNFDTILSPDRGAGASASNYLAYVQSTDVLDTYTVQVTLSQPFSSFLDEIAQPFVGIQSPDAIKRGQDVNCVSPVGTGPFVIDSYTPGSEAVLVPNPAYNSAPTYAQHEGAARVDKVIWKFVPDPNTRISGVQSGQFAAADGLSPVDENSARSDSQLTVIGHDFPGNAESLVFRQNSAPFDDERVRQAFAYASDVQSALDSVLFGLYDRTGILSPTTPDYDPTFNSVYDFDLDEANQLLDDAGWTVGNDGIRTKGGDKLAVTWAWPDVAEVPAAYQTFAEQIQATAKQVGFEVTLAPTPIADYITLQNDGSAQIYWSKWTLNSADALRITFGSAAAEAGVPGGYISNPGHVTDPELDAALRSAATTTDRDERADFYSEAQRIISEKAYGIGLFEQTVRIVSNDSKVQGVQQEPALGLVYLYDAWVSSN